MEESLVDPRLPVVNSEEQERIKTEYFQRRLQELRNQSIAPTPPRNIEQRRAALKSANRIRCYRAQLKKDLKAGKASIHLLLLNPPEDLESMKLIDLIPAVPKYGKVKTNKTLRVCRISPSKTVGGLSERQRAEIISMLRR